MSEDTHLHRQPNASDELRANLTSRFAYLFTDIEQEMRTIWDADAPIRLHNEAIAKYEATFERAKAAEAEAKERADSLALEYEALLRRMKEIQRGAKVARGEVNSWKHTQVYMKTLIAKRRSKISEREKQLLLNEARKRLGRIGRQIRLNRGRRTSILGRSGDLDVL